MWMRREVWMIGVLGLIACLNARLGIVVSEVKGEDVDLLRKEGWHQFRGPEGNGVSRGGAAPVVWGEKKNVKWKVEVEGHGSSTPIVWSGKVFLLTAIDTGKVDPSLPKPEDQPRRVFGITHPNTWYRFVVLCLDRKTGKVIWRRVATEKIPHEGVHGDNNYASASPTTDGERLYCWFGSAGLFCYDLQGKKLWERDLGKAYVGASLGEGCSPVVYDGKVVIVRDHSRQSTIEVLDSKTGRTIWKKKRDERNAWATPYVVEYGGKTQVITAASNKVRSYELGSGEIIWECGGLTGNVIPAPVVGKGVVYVMSGYKGYKVMALPLGEKGDISGKVIWAKRRGTPYVPSPVLYDGLLYYLQSNQAILSCVDARTGDVVFNRKRLEGLSMVYAGLVGAGDHVYVVGRYGRMVVLKKGRAFKIVARNRLNDRFDGSPAVAGGELYLRGRKYLYCVGK